MICLQLFLEFFRTGLFSIGGGLATLPFLYSMSDKTGWFTYDQIADMLAISESTPGPIGVNMSTYVGYNVAGLPGAVIATLGLICPSIIVILIIARFLKSFRDNRYVDAAFYGLRPASTGLIAAAGFSVAVLSLLNTGLYSASGNILDLFRLPAIILAVAVFAASRLFKKLHPIVLIIASAAAGIVFKLGVT